MNDRYTEAKSLKKITRSLGKIIQEKTILGIMMSKPYAHYTISLNQNCS